jgi:peptide/nickel transport system ATP-binding protein
MTELLSVKNISYSVKHAKSKTVISILKNISFDIYEGEIAGICGESGGGKTTLARIIAGLLTPVEGKIIWNDKKVNKQSAVSPVQILFQNNGEILNPFRRINDVINEALKIAEKNKNLIDQQKEMLFNAVGLTNDLGYRKGYELSGGEQQKAALARLLAVSPKLLILDEPFSAQDSNSQLNLVRLFKKINKDFNITILCISHDLNILRKLVHRVLIIKEGEIVESGKTEKILKTPVHPYTKFLLRAESFNLSYDELHSSQLNE